ncbi:NAD-dependent epimerase/dehydratase family protein [Guptibacillus hwajinpoensis]|uniref:UDP-glucose 4-epimerase n=1 Tax=Guptibacillus hwajinpoensis TaxID=208199 RepID=A0ABU0K044_9BACL|nr:NAD-dependent epimerase/dehydratase family protein [Alkalihalobacillus hemicentroti]MDQ0482691.1 UDP-glucose 4-epimerase [Alkalihalobacillus hemicentroti]
MKVLVTGGAGFIGSHIVDLLIEEGYKPVVIDNLSTGNPEFLQENVSIYKEDISSVKLEEIFARERPDVVIHHAAQVDVSRSLQNPYSDAQTNIIGTIRLLECCKKFNVKKIIYASSCAIYGDAGDISIKEEFPKMPISFYGISKYTPELYIKKFHKLYGLTYTILRYANVYGPRQTPKGEGGVVSIFIQNLKEGDQPTIFGDGQQTRDFVYVKDVARANLLALYDGDNETFNIGCNRETSINKLFQLITSLLNKQLTPVHSSKREGDIRNSRLDFTKAIQHLGWSPHYNLITGLKETIDYFGISLST